MMEQRFGNNPNYREPKMMEDFNYTYVEIWFYGDLKKSEIQHIDQFFGDKIELMVLRKGDPHTSNIRKKYKMEYKSLPSTIF